MISTPAIGINFAITLGANREKMLVDAWECLINFRTRSLWANLEQVQLRLSWRQVKLAVVETSPTHYSNTNRPQQFFSEKKEICLRPFFSPSHTFVIVTLMHCIGTKFYLKKNWSRSAGYLLFMITNFGEKVATAPIRSGHSHVRHLKTDINGIQSMKCTRVHLHHPFSLPYTGMHVHLVNAHFVTNISLQTAYREERK